MGLNWTYIKKLESIGAFDKKGAQILDIGSSNLYSASAEDISDFVRRHTSKPPDDLESFSQRLAAGSAYDPVHGGLNKSFAGELFERAGFQYNSIDIADGYKTTIVDLNKSLVSGDFRGKFDLVTNFGTTEHVFDQENCFKYIHESAKPGGLIFHQLPSIGWIDHCYFTYTSRFFLDLAEFNKYEILSYWFDYSEAEEDVFRPLEQRVSRHPALRQTIENKDPAIDSLRIPSVAISVLFRKRYGRPFVGAVDMTTSVGTIPQNVLETYAGAAGLARSIVERIPFLKRIALVFLRLVAGSAHQR